MPDPNEFSHSKFPIDAVIYNTPWFSIAWGTWDDGKKCLGMRWNGEGEDAGYPKLFGNPVWFIVPKELTLPILKGLRAEATENVDLEAIAQALREA